MKRLKFTAFLFLTSIIKLVLCNESYIKQIFQNPNASSDLRHLAKETKTGNIYIGATNILYKLSPDLVLEQQAITGPQLDNPLCIPNLACQHTLIEMTSYNKVLIVDENNGKLIACSSLFQGMCEKRSLENILDKDKGVFEPVAANNATATTVAFIGPGPSSGPESQDVLYVGAQYTEGSSFFRDLVPAFSMRRLDNFQLFYKGLSTSSSKQIETQQKNSFPVHYVHGFSSEGFSYVVTLQKESATSEKIISKLIRVCQYDKNFYSYTEVPLRCQINGKEYTYIQATTVGKSGVRLAQSLLVPVNADVLFGVFSLDKNYKDRNQSALCMFPMREVRKIFTKNIRQCFMGIGKTGPDHIVNPSKCIKISLDIDDDYCGIYDLNTPINGNISIESVAALEMDTAISGIKTYTANYNTLGIIGSRHGQIFQIAIESGSQAYIFNKYDLEDNGPILEDIVLDNDEEHAYVLTEKKVYKLAVQTCGNLKKCDDCLAGRNPHCGWCSKENKCSVKEECLENELDLRWLDHDIICTYIKSAFPEEIPKDITNPYKNITLQLINLPDWRRYNYTCVFDGNELYHVSPLYNINPFTFTCDVPSTNKWPNLTEKGLVVTLSIQFSKTKITSRNITLFDCNSHKSCTECLFSTFNCSWCISSHICTHNQTSFCETASISEKDINLQLLNKDSKEFCPRIQGRNDSTGYLYIPSGIETNVSVTGHGIRQEQLPLYCRFGVDDGDVFVSAGVTALLENTWLINCNSVYIHYNEESKYQVIPFSIGWGDTASKKFIDNLDNLQAQVYKCGILARTCGECVNLDKNYMCVWCDNRCSTKHHCLNKDWITISNDVPCPNPVITQIKPVSGTYNGGTLLTINGRNLGKTFQDIWQRIDIGGVPCIAMETKYIPSTKIVCETGEYIRSVPNATVRVTIDNATIAISSQTYAYTNPLVTHIYPNFGPVSGGTIVYLYGQYLNSGNGISIILSNKTCDIAERSENTVIFTTPSNQMGNLTVNIMLDDNNLVETSNISLYYRYLNDPEIIQITPLASFYSGGKNITVSGRNFLSVVSPKMFVIYKHKEIDKISNSSNCILQSDGEMVCLSPPVYVDIMNKERPKSVEGTVGFYMDEVQAVQFIAEYFPDVVSTIQYFPDPFVSYMGDVVLNGEILIIEGQFFGVSEMNETVGVTVGKQPCNVTFVLESQIQCYPPSAEDIGDSEGIIEVTIGKFVFNPGRLKYSVSKDSSFPWITISVVSIVSVVAVSLIIALIVIRYSRRKYSMKKDGMKFVVLSKSGGSYQTLFPLNAVAGITVLDEVTISSLKLHGVFIEKENVELQETLGSGQFGLVYKGFMKTEGESKMVAIKTVKGGEGSSVQEMVEEAFLMNNFNHPNVLNTIGIAVSDDLLPLVIMPYMKHGDLLSYIRNENSKPTVTILVRFGLDIARGMEYLAKRRFVHRDLAARNCMLDENLTARVGDFGLSRDIYSKDYYTCDNKKKLPFRWMAPESMDAGTCTEKSDVWSYGVLLWELMTRGGMPYPGVENWQLLRCLRSGLRLPRPVYCSTDLYDIMQNCWLNDPDMRPDFAELEKKVSSILGEGITTESLSTLENSDGVQVDIKKCKNYFYSASDKDVESDSDNRFYIEVLPDDISMKGSDTSEMDTENVEETTKNV